MSEMGSSRKGSTFSLFGQKTQSIEEDTLFSPDKSPNRNKSDFTSINAVAISEDPNSLLINDEPKRNSSTSKIDFHKSGPILSNLKSTSDIEAAFQFQAIQSQV